MSKISLEGIASKMSANQMKSVTGGCNNGSGGGSGGSNGDICTSRHTQGFPCGGGCWTSTVPIGTCQTVNRVCRCVPLPPM